MTYYAHSTDGPKSTWETMAEHESLVAERCSSFLERIHPDLELWGDLLGRWHDLGKYSDEFQAYIGPDNDSHVGETSGRVNHSSAGAQHAARSMDRVGRLIAYCIAGHHAGLADWIGGRGGLKARLDDESIPDYSSAPAGLLDRTPLPIPSMNFRRAEKKRVGFQLSLLTRSCFSALCDADFLATESFMSPKISAARPGSTDLNSLLKRLERHLASFGEPTSEVNRVRADVLHAAQEGATKPTGLFSLNVPTGGGKTLSSLAFGLRHAEEHGLERVIYAIPFTSIVEQTANVFHEIFDTLDPNAVLEHHSNLDPKKETHTSRLASENWDAPLVVTTNVQLFESLFACRTSRSRKVHRIAKSVIILDEVQTLPIHLLEPCLAVLRELCDLLGSTVVLCTATQPAVEIRTGFEIGLENVHPIVKEPGKLHARMKRVEPMLLGSISDDELVSKVVDHEKALCIVNTRPHANRIFSALKQSQDDTSAFHLSTFMCAAHRTKVLKQIKEELESSSCRVVSTQLIEAGVDIDFPVVFRAMTGLDSIAQAAGRCNREGKLPTGKLFVFEPEDVKLRGMLRQTADKAREVLALRDDILSLESVEQYFQLHYWQQKDRWDENDVMECLVDPQGQQHFQFRTAAERFRMIEETGRSVLVPWGDEGRELESRLRNAEKIGRDLRRMTQRYIVPIYENAFNEMAGRDIDVDSVEGIPILINMDIYDDELGVCLDRAGQHDPGGLIV